MRPFCAIGVVALALSLVGEASANPPFPGSFGWWKSLFGKGGMTVPQPKPTVRSTSPPALPSCPFELAIDDKADEIRLQVPRNLVKDLKVAEVPIATPTSGFAQTRHTLMAGVFLTLAFASGGLWLARRGLPGIRTLGVGAVLLLMLGGTMAWADIPPFGGFNRQRMVKAYVEEERLKDLSRLPQITVEVVEQGDAIKLLVSRERFAKLVEQAAPKVNP